MKNQVENIHKDTTDAKTSTYVTIFDSITSDVYENCVIPMLDSERQGIPIELYMSTGGGDLAVALSLGEILDRIQVKTDIYLLGENLSAGMFIAMGGYHNPNVTVYAYPSTVGLIHSGLFNFDMDRIELVQDYMHFYDSHMVPLIHNYILSHSKITEDVHEQFSRKDVWLPAEKLLEYGIVDVLL